MGLIKLGKHLLNKRSIHQINVKIIHPFWDVAKNKELAKQPGALVSAFGKVATHPEMAKIFELLLKGVDIPDIVDNVFTYTAQNILPEDYVELAKHIAASDTFSKFPPGTAMLSLRAMAKNCPPEQKLQMLYILEASGKLRDTLPRAGANRATEFYVDIFKEVATEDAIAHLRDLQSWQALDHNSEHFMEHVYHKDERLAPAIIKG